MKQDIFETTRAMVETIEDEADKGNVQRITSDQMLREEIGTFIVSEIQSIQSQNSFRDIIIREMMEKIRLHELDVKELLSLYRGVSTEKTGNIQAILDMFKPTSNTPNSLLAPKPANTNLDKYDQIIADADDEVLQGLWTLISRALDIKKKAKKEEGTNEI